MILLICLNSLSLLSQSWIVSTTPGKNALNVLKNANIEVKFANDIDPSTLTNATVKVRGSKTGFYATVITYSSDTRTAVIDPVKDFKPGEVVSVVLTRGIRFANGDSIPGSYVWSFTVKVEDGSGLFVRVGDVGVGSNPRSIHTSDLDGDGDIDIVVANSASNTVSILRNDGGLNFVKVSDIGVGSYPLSVHTSDLDGDGDIDIAVSNWNSNTVSILRNDGGLNFVKVSDIGVGSGPFSVHTSDLDGDGDIDIAVANGSSSTVSILRNDGGLNFVNVGDIGVGIYPYSVHTSDLDGDGDIDIAVANNGSRTVSILRNDGGLNFVNVGDIGVGIYPYSVHTSDLDGDGDIDIAVANSGSNTVSILRNDGGLNFVRVSDIGVGSGPVSVHTSDLDGDGDIDIAVANEGSNTVSILRNDGGLNFVRVSDVGVGSYPWSVHTSDLDGDGDIDIVVANYYSSTLSILRNRNRSADISLDKKVLSFGDVSVGSSKTLYLRIYNDGADSTLFVNLSIGSGSMFSVSRTSLSIGASDTDSVAVVFSPANYGSFEDSLVITSNDPNKPRLVVRLVGYSGNYVSGVITENTIWTRDNSPYIISGNLGIDAGVKLRIERGVRVVFKGRYNFNVDGILEVEGVEGDSVVFTSLYPDTMRYPGIRFRSGGRGSFRYVRVEYGDTGIGMNRGESLIIDNCVFKQNNVGVNIISTTNVSIKNLTFIGNGKGVSLISASAIIDSAVIVNSSSSGIYLKSSSASISNSLIKNSNCGIYNDEGYEGITSNLTVENSRIIGNSYGIYCAVTEYSYTTIFVNIRGSEISYNGYGILYEPGWESTNISIKSNDISNNTYWAFYMYDAYSWNIRGTISDNLIQNNGLGGIYLGGSYVGIKGNFIANNRGVGISSKSAGSIEDNIIYRNLSYGIEVSSNAAILRNRVINNLSDGINTSGNNQILYNDIYGNAGDGIEASGKPVVNYNNIYGNIGYNFRATLQASDSIDAKNNWWGSVDRDEISSKIYDFYDDGVTVRVRFEPYLMEKVGMFAVTGFRGESKAGGVIRLSWDRHPFASRYVLYKGEAGGLDSTTIWVELDSSKVSYEFSIFDGLYSFGIRAVSSDGRFSPLVVIDNVLSDSRAPVLVYAFGVQGDSVISVKFNEAVDFSSVADTSNWRLNLGLKVGRASTSRGYIVEYYNGENFGTFVARDTIRDASGINFNWGWGSPRAGVNSDYFSVRIRGYVYMPLSGVYKFSFVVSGYDGYRIIIGSDTLRNKFWYGWDTVRTVTRSFASGVYPLIFEFQEYYDTASVSLSWTRPDGVSELVPIYIRPNVDSYNLHLSSGQRLPVSDSLIVLRCRGISDLVGNVSGEQVIEFYPDDGNSNPSIKLSGIVGEVSGDVRIDYVISDIEGDSVRLRCEYSVDGDSWFVASVVGDTVNIGRDRYRGYLIWRSKLDLADYSGEVSFRVTPRDNDPHNWGAFDLVRFKIDNYHRHRIVWSLTDTLSEYSDTIKVNYTLIDTTKDILKLKGYYRKDAEVNWKVATLIGDTANLDTTKYTGIIRWLSRRDLDGYDGYVWLKFEVNDGWVSNSGDSLRFKLDNNYPPLAILARVTSEQSDSVRLRYTLSDVEGDSLKIVVEYSEDGNTWRGAKIVGDTIIKPSNYSGEIVWLSREDLPGRDLYVYVRLTPMDNDIGEADTIRFKLDNNYPPVVKIDSIYGIKRRTGAYKDTLTFFFSILDSEGDTVRLRFFFKNADSVDAPWSYVTVSSGDTGDVMPGRYTFKWATNVDLPGSAGNYYFKIIPSDLDQGLSDSILVQIDNLGVPHIALLDSFAGEYTGDITFNYRIVDEEGDTIKLVAEFSQDDGRSWRKATVVGDTLISDSTKYVGSLIWKSNMDLSGFDGFVRFRITPFDANRGIRSEVIFHLDNNGPPVVSLLDTFDVVGGDILIRFLVRDLEGDSLRFEYKYKFGHSWRDADVSFGSRRGDTLLVIWHSYRDVVDTFGLAYFKVIPYDVDEGVSDSMVLKLDNKLARIYLSDLDGERGGDIVISYRIDNDTLSSVYLYPEYFHNGRWNRATIEGDTVVDHRKYSGSFVWKSLEDLRGYDIDSLMFRVLPKDITIGVPDTIIFHLDNNEVPVIRYIETSVVEVSGEFEIKFVPFDQERDSLRFKFEYSVGDTMSWKNATIRMGSRYGDTLGVIWLSNYDLANQDVWVYFKITPFDRDTGKYAISGKFNVDNQTGPIILSTSPVNISFYNDTIKIKFDRKVYGIGSGVKIYGSLTGVHQFNSLSFDTVFYLIPSPHFASAETVTVKIIADSIKDSNGNTFDGDKDGDPEGSPVDDITLTFVSTIPGDYNFDKKVNIEDLALFRDVWINNYTSKEIGPATGKPPQMIVQPDGKVDFEDLMIFVMNWNWLVKTGGFKLASKILFGDMDSSKLMGISKAYKEQLLMFDKVETSNKYSRIGGLNNRYISYDVKFNLTDDFADTIYAGEFVLRYDPEILQFVGIKDNDVFGKLNDGKTIFLSYVDSVNGLVIINFANFGNLGMLRNDVVARIDFKVLKELEGEGAIAWELFGVSGNVYEFYDKVELNTIPEIPKEFALLQNYPNPFNPNTVIRYHVPRYSRVVIKIYDITGREVTVLVDDYFKPGYYEVVWDSRRRDGVEVSSGVYFYVMEAVEDTRNIFRSVRKMVVVK
ncbi:Cohesin domain-containing protein [Candidatus Kryptobacter tengchongensis]|nr:Cohesin domain-containing protein [Candidatus Kryptobacter tengchongensis]